MSGNPNYNFAVDTPLVIRRVIEHLDDQLLSVSSSRLRPNWLTYPYSEKHFNELGRTNHVRGLLVDSILPLLFAGLAITGSLVLEGFRVQGWTMGLFILVAEIFSQVEMHRLVRRVLPALGEFLQIEQVISGDLDPGEIFKAVPFPWNVLFLGAKPTAVEDMVRLLVFNLDWFAMRTRSLIRWTWVMMLVAPACFPLVSVDSSFYGYSGPIRSFIFSLGLTALLFGVAYAACSRRRLTLMAIALGWLERRYILQFRDISGED